MAHPASKTTARNSHQLSPLSLTTVSIGAEYVDSSRGAMATATSPCCATPSLSTFPTLAVTSTPLPSGRTASFTNSGIVPQLDSRLIEITATVFIKVRFKVYPSRC